MLENSKLDEWCAGRQAPRLVRFNPGSATHGCICRILHLHLTLTVLSVPPSLPLSPATTNDLDNNGPSFLLQDLQGVCCIAPRPGPGPGHRPPNCAVLDD